MSAFIGTSQSPSYTMVIRPDREDGVTSDYLVQKQRDKSLARLLLSIRVDSHEPVRCPVLGPDAEHAGLELLSVLHLHLLGKVGNTPGVIVLGVGLVVGEGPAGGDNGRLLHPGRGGLLALTPAVAETGVGHHTLLSLESDEKFSVRI